jgi:hypothetical protein
MAELQIKIESLPERCEVCHKADRFDAHSNYCSRCANVKYLYQAHLVEAEPIDPVAMKRTIIVTAILGGGYGIYNWLKMDSANVWLIFWLIWGAIGGAIIGIFCRALTILFMIPVEWIERLIARKSHK